MSATVGHKAGRLRRSLARAKANLLAAPTTAEVNGALIESGVLSIGFRSYGNPTIHLFGLTPEDLRTRGGRVDIGAFCSIGADVDILTGGNHRIDWVTTWPFPGTRRRGHPATKGDVTIGNDVWIGMRSMILSGVTIGDGAVVGAGSIVSSDVAPYTIVAGNPAAPIRKRFRDDQIEALLDIRWWDWPPDQAFAAVDRLCSTDIDGFIDWAHRTGGREEPTPS